MSKSFASTCINFRTIPVTSNNWVKISNHFKQLWKITRAYISVVNYNLVRRIYSHSNANDSQNGKTICICKELWIKLADHQWPIYSLTIWMVWIRVREELSTRSKVPKNNSEEPDERANDELPHLIYTFSPLPSNSDDEAWTNVLSNFA